MSYDKDKLIAHLLADDIHEEVNQDPVLRSIIEGINANLGESPEAIRGAILAFSIVAMVVMMAGRDKADPSAHLIKLMAAWQAQPHVMAILDKITE